MADPRRSPLSDLRERFGMGWLVKHVTGTDVKYAQFARGLQ
jgi:hypothetical protein